MGRLGAFFLGFILLLISSEVFGQCPAEIPTSGGTISATVTLTTDCVVTVTGPQVELLLTNKNLTIAAGASLTVIGDFRITNGGGRITVNGILDVSGNFTNEGNGDIGANGIVKVGGDFTLGGQSTLTVSGGLSVVGTVDLTSGKTATITGVLSAGTLTGTTPVSVDGGTIYVENGIPATVTLVGTPPDADCTNNCCGTNCNTGGTDLSDTGNETLPIELSSFDVIARDTYVEIQWVSQTELNNDFYELERAVSGAEFSVIARLEGAGTSRTPISYSYQDYSSIVGLVYYRLKQTDYDGEYEYFDVKAFDASGISVRRIQIMPNRAQSGNKIKIAGLPILDESIRLQLVDLSGKNSFNIEIRPDFGQNAFVVPNVNSGVYILIGEAYGLEIRKRMIISQ
ncbi:MAG: hypothetical protein RIA69_04480 [Cyclobacteriaceae bacterium]